MPPYDNVADSNRAWTHEGVDLVNVAVAGPAEGARTLLDLSQQLARRVRELLPDIVHVFKPIGVSALTQWQLAGAYAKRTVVDNDDWEGRGGWLDVNPYSRAQKVFAAWQEGWSLRAARAVTCASHALVERTVAFRRADGARSTLLFPNGPDNALLPVVERARQRRETLREQFGWRGPTAIYAGTIPHGHDMDIAVSAIAATPGLRWVIVASGGGIPELKARIATADIGERVEWHSFMPHSALVERLVASDIGLYPYRDTNINRAKCSGKVIDYMAAGLPMVVSDVGMNRAYLEHGRSALLTPPGDAAAFADALRQLVADPAAGRAMGDAARLRVWREFGWDERIAQLEQLYAALATA
jgi:glycosyltransferase involved in cell wall biosynthesis